MDIKPRLTEIATHGVWLAYMGFFVSTLFGRGLYKEFLYAVAGLSILGMAVRPRMLERIRIFIPVVLAGLAVALMGGVMAAPGYDKSSQILIIQFLIVICCTFVLPDWPYSRSISLESALTVVLGGFVLAQGSACVIRENISGLFSNIHYLSLSAAIIIPLLVYLFLRSGNIGRTLCALILAADILLMLKTQSRPAWLAVVVGSAVVTPFLGKRYSLYAAAAIVFIPLLLYLSRLFGVAQRIDSFIVKFSEEERQAIWLETLRMQMESGKLEWMFGHGFERFVEDFKKYSSFHERLVDFVFPHNFFLEILYANGIVGLVAVVGFYGYFLFRLSGGATRNVMPEERGMAVMLLSITVIHFTHTFFTVAFYSKYTLIFLGIFVAAGFRIFSATGNNKAPPTGKLRVGKRYIYRKMAH